MYQQPQQPQAVYSEKGPGPQYPTPQVAYAQQPQPQMVQMQQPQPTMGMTVGPGGNRNAKNVPFNPNGKRDWSNGICDCFDDCGTCLMAWFCPCMVYAQVKQRLEYLNQRGIPDPERGGSGCNGDCMVHGLLSACLGIGWVLQISNRGSVRHRYSIEGGGCGDCCTVCWCSPCQLTQESREIELEERSFMH
ncbi:hypothetical protein AMATHDRAFT_66586 [Amanita thiersii Skay4041]|uniref:PLAC8-domain-containing protein n=1 Tax=Amanita thiersii Skay4041 TaxID=703135 RepID=A0A2A9NB99_9AGAR|nr:hypothetical protein AMATHDRAFT_66586 [Amanita thiersii Skay4041]